MPPMCTFLQTPISAHPRIASPVSLVAGIQAGRCSDAWLQTVSGADQQHPSGRQAIK